MRIFDRIQDAARENNLHFDVSAGTPEKFQALCERHVAKDDIILIPQNGRADRLCFLETGTARFFKQRRASGTHVATVSDAMTPLGLSGLNSPGRYMSEIRLSAGSEYLALDLPKLRDLFLIDPHFAAQFLSFVLARSTQLLWATRGLQSAPPPDAREISPGVAHSSDHDVARRLAEAAFFSPLSTERILELLAYCELRLYSAGETIVAEGQVSQALHILFSGRVRAAFTDARDSGPTSRTRTIVRPGVALSWNNGCSELPAPYTVIASRDTTMLTLSGDSLRRLMQDKPMLAAALMQQQIWQIGRYQQTAARLSNMAIEDEAAHVEALIQDNFSRIPVQSVLHGVAHALRNRFTVGYALDCVYEAVISGNDAERSVAGLVLDVLDGVAREHRFFNGLNAVYTRVTSAARSANATNLRDLSNADFSRAFDQVAYAIKGIENLPDSPTNIFFYNHLAACPDNELANGHAFSIDSHFLSAKILMPKYGDGGQRIVRSSRNTEFWRNGYYSRLDNIFVHNAESDWNDETPEEKNSARRSFSSKRNVLSMRADRLHRA